MEKIRCIGCRGAKKVPKLGGMIGECNMCKGTGQMNACDKPVAVVADPVEVVDDLIKQVSECVRSTPVNFEPQAEIKTLPVEPQVKVDGKKAIYKRKKG